MSKLENPSVRWAIAFAYLGVSLFLLLVLAELPRADQIVVVIVVVFGFLILPSTLKDLAEQL